MYTLRRFEPYAEQELSCGSQHGDQLGALIQEQTEELYALRRHGNCRQHLQALGMFSGNVMSRQQVAEWCHKVASGRKNVTDDNSSKTTEVKTTRFDELIPTSSSVIWRRMASGLGLSHDTVQHIVGDVLQYRKNVHFPSLEGVIVRELFHPR